VRQFVTNDWNCSCIFNIKRTTKGKLRYSNDQSICNIQKRDLFTILACVSSFAIAVGKLTLRLKFKRNLKRMFFTLIALFEEKDKIERVAENVRRKRNADCEFSCTNDRGLLPKVGRMSLFPAGCRKLSSQENCANSARACLGAALICCLKRFCPTTCNDERNFENSAT